MLEHLPRHNEMRDHVAKSTDMQLHCLSSERTVKQSCKSSIHSFMVRNAVRVKTRRKYMNICEKYKAVIQYNTKTWYVALRLFGNISEIPHTLDVNTWILCGRWSCLVVFPHSKAMGLREEWDAESRLQRTQEVRRDTQFITKDSCWVFALEVYTLFWLLYVRRLLWKFWFVGKIDQLGLCVICIFIFSDRESTSRIESCLMFVTYFMKGNAGFQSKCVVNY